MSQNKVVLLVVAILGLVTAETDYEDAATYPINGMTAADCSAYLFIADAYNMCWYHQCVVGVDGYYLLPRRCALGVKLPYDYTISPFNPCTESYTGQINYECSREEDSYTQVPSCMNEMECYNGGTLLYEGSTCWCVCPDDWQGDWLCQRPTGADYGLPEGSDICVDGQPMDDWCGNAGGCLNGGVCYNQCNDYWCDCPVPYTWSKRCDQFSCGDDHECYNGGTCDRSYDGLREYRICSCPAGYSGYQCQYEDKK